MEKESILIVEDDLQSLQAFEKILSTEGYETTAIDSSEEALKLIKKNEYNLVLSDIVMKGIDGLQILSETKKMNPETMVILITGYVTVETAIKALRDGAVDYILKPCKEDELKIRIKRALERQRLGKEHKQMEIALEESERKLNSIVSTVPDIIYRLDSTGKITFINVSVKKYGYDIEELIGTDFLDLVHPDDREKAAFRINERRTGDRSTKFFELRLLRKDKTAVPFEDKSIGIEDVPFFLIDAEGLYASVELKKKSFVGTQGIARDITERKKADKEIKELLEKESKSAREWQETFDSAHDIIILLSPDQRFIKINKTGYEALNKKPGEIIGKKCYEIVHGLDKPIDDCPCIKAIETKEGGVSEITEHGRNYLITASPVFEKNELKYFVHTVKDITERKHLEEQLQIRQRTPRWQSACPPEADSEKADSEKAD